MDSAMEICIWYAPWNCHGRGLQSEADGGCGDLVAATATAPAGQPHGAAPEVPTASGYQALPMCSLCSLRVCPLEAEGRRHHGLGGEGVVGVHQILFRLMVVFQPGGAQDRAQLLRQLDVSESSPRPAEAVLAIRKWYRLLQRAADLNI